MGYEVKYIYHPKSEEGRGYDTDATQEKTVKVGKPFDDTPLEKCAAAIMAQLARRDIWVVDVEVYELVKKQVSFKESKDGKGIVLKNKRFSLNATAEMVQELDTFVATDPEPAPPQAHEAIPTPAPVATPPGAHPHERIQIPTDRPNNNNPEELYSNTGATSVRRSVDPRSIDRSKKLYHVYFEPGPMYIQQARALKLKLSEDTRYPVHAVIPSPTGKIDQQQIAITDDSGNIVITDERFFTTAGAGLMGDAELDFSGSNKPGTKRARLSFENEMQSSPQIPDDVKDIPVDTGEIPPELLDIPDIRST